MSTSTEDRLMRQCGSPSPIHLKERAEALRELLAAGDRVLAAWKDRDDDALSCRMIDLGKRLRLYREAKRG